MRTAFLFLLSIFFAAPAFAQDCRYGFAYGHVFDLETGEELHVTRENLADRLLQVGACLASEQSAEAKFLSFESDELADLPLLTRFFVSFYDMPDADGKLENIDLAWALVDQTGLSRAQIESDLADAGYRIASRNDWHPHLVDGYISNCRAADVPVPGPIGGNDWSDKIDISEETTLIFNTADEMSIWLHGIDQNGVSTSDGFCVAFKRVLTNDIPIGTICMNEARTQACFFDNMKYMEGEGKLQRMKPKETLESEFRDMAHVMDLENCSSCHVGDNPLLLHPGTTLHKIFQTGKTKSADFDFVSFGNDRDWCNPDTIASSDGCSRCHDIALSAKPARQNYCSVLKLAANTTMPPSRRSEHAHIRLWPGANGSFEDEAEIFEEYFSSLRELEEMCGSYGGISGTCSEE